MQLIVVITIYYINMTHTHIYTYNYKLLLKPYQLKASPFPSEFNEQNVKTEIPIGQLMHLQHWQYEARHNSSISNSSDVAS